MGTSGFAVLGVLLVVLQSSTAASVPQDGLSRIKRETVDEEVPVIYFPKATKGLRRERREWTLPDINFPENDRGPFPKKVSQIRSSSDATMVIHYSITGPGADQPPVGLFTMDKLTGILYVTQSLDRETKSNYTFMVHAVAEGSGKTETPMEIKIIVIDQNDNRPEFTESTYTGEVAEASPIGHEILKVTATDADEEGTMNAELRYSIVSQDPKSPTDHMFDINPVTGYIRVNAAGLDREKNPKYTLVVQAADLEGNGMATTANVLLTVTDSSTQTTESSTAASVPQDGLSRIKRETVDEEVPVIYFPKATKGLRRKKRDWVIPDIHFPENDKGPFPKKVSQIRSSKDATMVMHYSITGPGADQPPVSLFVMGRTTGILYVTQPLDRETKSDYTFMVHAVAEGSGKGETPMEFKVTVIDQNDNRPVFTESTYTGEVAEASPIGHEILKVTATDADEEGTMNAELRYSIVSQDPKSPTDHMFDINPVTGYIRVNAAGLDREKNPKYTLVVQAADMEGNGMVTTANVLLTVTDRNDHAPVYTQTQFTASVPENQEDALVAKMAVTDEDDAHTPAWNAKFTIVDGDRDGLFTVTTSATNKQEGIITTAKGLDFEVSGTHTLLVAVENEVPFATPLPTATATVVVTVSDVDEAPILEL